MRLSRPLQGRGLRCPAEVACLGSFSLYPRGYESFPRRALLRTGYVIGCGLFSS